MSDGTGNGTRYIAFGVCFGLLSGTGLGLAIGAVTASTGIALPVLSGVGLVVGTFIGMQLAARHRA